MNKLTFCLITKDLNTIGMAVGYSYEVKDKNLFIKCKNGSTLSIFNNVELEQQYDLYFQVFIN